MEGTFTLNPDRSPGQPVLIQKEGDYRMSKTFQRTVRLEDQDPGPTLECLGPPGDIAKIAVDSDEVTITIRGKRISVFLSGGEVVVEQGNEEEVPLRLFMGR